MGTRLADGGMRSGMRLTNQVSQNTRMSGCELTRKGVLVQILFLKGVDGVW